MNNRYWPARRRNRLIAATVVALIFNMAHAEQQVTVPDFMEIISGTPPVVNFSTQSPTKSATEPSESAQEILNLNAAMMGIYGGNLARFSQNLRAQHPVIIALFNGGGGSMILYTPDKPPVVAPNVPSVYKMAKSVSHSSMAVFQLLAPYLKTQQNGAWRRAAGIYRDQLLDARRGLTSVNATESQRKVFDSVLSKNIALLDRCLTQGTYTYSDLESFALSLRPELGKTTTIAGTTQVQHWNAVLRQWKHQLGSDWERTYAATNTLYVTRRNNILFTLLAQQMGRDAINTRLLLFETSSFTTTPDQMLELLTRIVADRALGKVFFNDYYLMDSELLTAATRRAMESDSQNKSMIPPLAPFLTHAWPWQTTQEYGTGPSVIDWAARDHAKSSK